MAVNASQCSVLLLAGAGLIGCVDAEQTGAYKSVSQLDAQQSQQAIDSEVAADPMQDPVTPDSAAAKSTDNVTTPTEDKSSSPETKTVADADSASSTNNNKAVPTDTVAANDASATDKPEASTDTKPEATVATPVEKSPPKLLIESKEFRTTAPNNVLRVSFDDIDPEKIFDIKEVAKDTPQYFPKWLKDLNGQRIRIRGFMYPPFQASELVGFTLTRDTSACCFGPNPKVCYLIEVWMKDGQTTDYIENRPFDVVGVFEIGEQVVPGKLYTLKDAVVIPK